MYNMLNTNNLSPYLCHDGCYIQQVGESQRVDFI